MEWQRERGERGSIFRVEYRRSSLSVEYHCYGDRGPDAFDERNETNVRLARRGT